MANINIIAICSSCNKELNTIVGSLKYDDLAINVDPCDCEYQNGYDKGYDEGNDDGYRAAENAYEELEG